MIGTIALTGSLLAGGVIAYRRKVGGETSVQPHFFQKLADWRLKVTKRGPKRQSASAPGISAEAQRARFGLQTSSISLALLTAGQFLPLPFTYASIPTLILMGVAPARKAYASLHDEGRVGLALVETAALGACLAGGYLWIGSLGFTGYYLGRLVLEKQKESTAPPRPVQPLALPQTALLYRDEVKMEVPVASLQKGDCIALASGDLSPVEGQIVEGAAWLTPAAVGFQAEEVWKEVGSRIYRGDIVVLGQIRVQVQPRRPDSRPVAHARSTFIPR